MEPTSFGKHLTLDGYGCNSSSLGSIARIYHFLDNAPKLVSMTKIMPPYVFHYTAEKIKDSGISGVVLIAESHISIHTYPEYGYLSMDLFSCKDFDEDKIIRFVKNIFLIKEVEINLIERGKKFKKD